MSESIQVAVRVRPLGAKDADAKSQLSTAGKVVSIQHLDQAFSYTEVYGTRSTQEEVFDKSVMPLLPSLFKGFNLTILAYGQTGSGKTYTMGTAGGNDNGIITKSIAHIFRQASSDPDCEFNVSVSFLEVIFYFALKIYLVTFFLNQYCTAVLGGFKRLAGFSHFLFWDRKFRHSRGL